MRSRIPYFTRKQTGFSLVEILVGLVIGLLATLVIMQVFSVFEGQKRSTTGASDAQTNGGIALYSLVRDLQMAGYGLAPIGDAGVADSALECTSLTENPATGFSAAGPAILSPAIITDGAGGTSDTITLHFGNSAMGGLPVQLTTDLSAGTAAVATVSNNLSCVGTHTLITINGSNCALTSASAVAAASNVAQTITLANAVAAPADTYLSCLGQWTETVYAVNAGNLERNGVPSVADIVSLQAQYGLSASPDSNEVTLWKNATGAFAAGAITVADRNRIKALRVAVIARNGQLEKNAVSASTACSATSSANPTGVCAWAGDAANPAPTVDLSALPNWQQYRYKVFETIIPLRNIIWAKGTL
jgi:type IV pilus assembly protein PilW